MPNQQLKGRAADAAARRDQNKQQTAELARQVLPSGTTDHRGAEIALPDPMRDLMAKFEPEIGKQLVNTGIDPGAFTRLALTGLKTSKQARLLAQCTRPSLFTALLEAARCGLMPFTDEGAIVPFYDRENGYTATFIPMYQGFVKQFYNTGQVARVVRGLIHQRDDWALAYGDGGGFYHKPVLFDPETGGRFDRGPVILAYCYLLMRDGTRTEVDAMPRWEAEEIRDKHSKSYAQAEKRWNDSDGKYGRDSTWHTDFDAMWQKSVIRKHAKNAPKSTTMLYLLMLANRDDTRPEVAAQAPPPMEMPPMPEADSGIDWSKTAGGATPGEVISDDDPDGWGGATAAPPARPGTEPAPGDGDSGEIITAATAARLHSALGGYTGLRGAALESRRQILMLALAGYPAPIGDPRAALSMTEAQGAAALDQLEQIKAAAAEGGNSASETLQRLYAAAGPRQPGAPAPDGRATGK